MLNAKPEHAEREGEIIAEAGRPGRGHDRHQHGRPRRRHQARRQRGAPDPARARRSAASSPTREDWDKAWDELFPQIEEQVEADREQVMEAGGLFILGTERHESRRIDNQLRGRSGRQGDPGESRFYLSAEDDLVRLFAGDRIYRILDNKFLGPVGRGRATRSRSRHKMLSKQIEGAQKKVEEQNFLHPQARPRVRRRDEPAARDHLRVPRPDPRGRGHVGDAREQIADAIERHLRASTWRASSRRTGTSTRCSRSSSRSTRSLSSVEDIEPSAHRPRVARSSELREDVVEAYDEREEELGEELMRALERFIGREERSRTTSTTCVEGEGREALVEKLRDDVVDAYNEREEELGDELMRALERFMLLQIIDERWREHLHDMDYLREGIHLRGFAQIDPLVAYKNEGFEMFTELMNNIWDEFARYIFNVEVEVEARAAAGRARSWGAGGTPARAGRSTTPAAAGAEQRRDRRGRGGRRACRRGVAEAGRDTPASEVGRAAAGGRDAPRSTSTSKIGRNDPCWCGSGKKFKKCHGCAVAVAPDGLRDQLKLLADYL